MQTGLATLGRQVGLMEGRHLQQRAQGLLRIVAGAVGSRFGQTLGRKSVQTRHQAPVSLREGRADLAEILGRGGFTQGPGESPPVAASACLSSRHLVWSVGTGGLRLAGSSPREWL